MPTHRLAEELCQQVGSALPADQADAAANFARMLMRGTIEDHAAFVRRRSAIVTQLMRHTALSEPHAALLADLAGSPQHRGFMDRRERDAFSYRFGEAVLRRFESSFSGDVDLSSYSEHYGPGETLRLLDAMLAVVGDGGPISPAELRRIEATASELGVEPGVVAHLLRRHDPRHAGGVLRVPLAPRLRIGTSPAADMVLVEPQAGSIRAELVQDPPGTESEAGWRVRDSGSGRPTLLNGKAIREAPFRAGDQLRIGSYTLNLDLEAGMLEAKSDWSAAPLSVRGLSRRLGDVVLLDDVSFTVLRGEVVAVVGPSGSGKTTLLSAITGTTPADRGEVHYEGQPFHDLLARDRSLVGLVPQDDIVHAELSVAESLSFGAALRFPRDADPEDQAEAVERVLDELGMEAIRDRRIGDALHRGISGGQRKRVNLGQELLTRSTRVLFLDEPTSGLDPRAAQEIVRVVRQLADRGRIVFLVTHDLSPQVMALVDHLLVLAPGGRLAWFGPPREACRYFNVDTPDAIFHTFHDRSPTAWAEAWRQSPAYQRYVVLREKLLDLEPAGALPPPPLSRPSPSARTQFMTLVRRYSVVKVRDVGGLVVQLAQPIVLAAVVGVVFPKPTASMLFVVSLSCLWFGMSSSVRELISDRVIWNRERRAGVGVASYVGSRMVVLAGLTVAQCIALTGFVIGLHDLSSYDFSLLSLAGITSLTGLVGMSLGLCISAFASSSEAAVGALPLLLIPQISFSALLVHLRNMTEIANYLSYLNPQRYAYDAILKTGARIGEQPRYGGPWKEPVGMAGVLYDMGFKGAEAADMGMPLPMLSAILLLFFAVFMAGTLIGVSRRQ